jgi:hypothetical protein
MTLFHAVAFVDHHNAQVLQFGREHSETKVLHEHLQLTRQHGSNVRTEHEFFGQVCDALEGIAEVLIVGGRQGLGDFRHYVEKHRPQTGLRIVGYDVVDHPSQKELVALARKRFVGIDQMAGTPVPT